MKKLFNFLASYGLACVLLLLLLLLTFLGTLEQVDQGIYSVQKKYFESVFLVHYLFGVIPLPLPGAYLLLSLLAVNLLLGAIVRAPKGLSHWGVLVGHLGIAILLLGSLIKYEAAEEGYLTLYEGDASGEYASYHDWEIAIAPAAPAGDYTEYIIPEKDFLGLPQGSAATFTSAQLPFDLTVTDSMSNSRPQPASASSMASAEAVDGFYLEEQPFARQAEQNIAGAYVAITDKAGAAAQKGILWGMSLAPLVVEAGGESWSIDLRRRRSSLPFTVKLDRFIRELHPRTNIPKAFVSEATVTDGGMQQSVRISMNEPLRREGYTLYQSSWGPPNAGPGDRLYSTFAVSRNPVEDIPLYASLIISFGLFVHFGQRLLRYLRRETRSRA